MKAIIRQRVAARKRRLAKRLDKFNYPEDLSRPMLRAGNVRHELAGRGSGTAQGGIGLMQQLVHQLGLAEAIDRRLHLFKVHLPYHESDHVLSLAYNAAGWHWLPQPVPIGLQEVAMIGEVKFAAE